MIELLARLVPLSLVGNLSVIPIASVPLIMLLSERWPVDRNAFLQPMFALPLESFLLLFLLLGVRAERWFQSINDFLSRWVGRLLLIALIGLGIILIIDGIGWLVDMPLVPIGR